MSITPQQTEKMTTEIIYVNVVKKMWEFIADTTHDNRMARGAVFGWISEFGETNFEWNKQILTALYTNDDPMDSDYAPEQLALIKQLGQDTYDRGGMVALQANYYIMSNYMDFGKYHSHHISSLQAIWSGVGEWRY